MLRVEAEGKIWTLNSQARDFAPVEDLSNL